MTPRTFRSFVKLAADLRFRDERVPADYIPVHEAVLEKFPGLQKTAVFGLGADLAGLGMLAYHPAHELKSKDKKEVSKARWELAGLGTLGAAVIGSHFFGKKPH